MKLPLLVEVDWHVSKNQRERGQNKERNERLVHRLCALIATLPRDGRDDTLSSTSMSNFAVCMPIRPRKSAKEQCCASSSPVRPVKIHESCWNRNPHPLGQLKLISSRCNLFLQESCCNRSPRLLAGENSKHRVGRVLLTLLSNENS